MKPIRVSLVCRTSLMVRTLVQSLLISSLIVIALILLIQDQQTRSEQLISSNAKLQDEIRFVKQSISAAATPSSSSAQAMSADKAQVIHNLSLNVADGLSMLEFVPVPQTKLKSISIEGHSISAEYELPSLQSATLVSNALNGDRDPMPWKLNGISRAESSGSSAIGSNLAPSYTGRWISLVSTNILP